MSTSPVEVCSRSCVGELLSAAHGTPPDSREPPGTEGSFVAVIVASGSKDQACSVLLLAKVKTRCSRLESRASSFASRVVVDICRSGVSHTLDSSKAGDAWVTTDVV